MRGGKCQLFGTTPFLSCYDGGWRGAVFYAIEKEDAEWVIYVHGVAILRCARSDIAFEVVKAAQLMLGDQALLGEALPEGRCGESGA